MEWNAKEPYVPVDEDGNWLSYPSWQKNRWELVTPFEDVLEVTGMTTGRSSKIINLKSVTNGIKYPMFVGDLVDAIRGGTLIEDGKIDATFDACKRGKNYGVRAKVTR